MSNLPMDDLQQIYEILPDSGKIGLPQIICAVFIFY